MFRILLSHTWQAMVRSVIWKRSLGASIFWGVIILLMALNMLSFGLFFDALIAEFYPDRDPVQLINGVLFYYLAVDLLLRRFLQRTPVLSVKSYLLLPVRRSSIIHFIILRSLISLFNILPLLILIPIVIRVLVPALSALTAWSWFAAIFLLMLSNSLLHVYLERQSLLRPGRLILIFVLLAAALGADKFDLFSLSGLSAALFGILLENPLLLSGPFIVFILIYRLNYVTFRRHMYLDRLAVRPGRSPVSYGGFDFLEKLFGETGLFLQLELKLLIRNKRSRASLAVGLVTLVIAPLVYFSLSRELEFYPRPDPVTISRDHSIKTSATDYQVTFRLPNVPLPENAWIYITGDHPNLTKWRPAGIPMQLLPDSSWQRIIAFPDQAQIRYIYTLGSWATETAKGDSLKPDTQTLTVIRDTTVIYADPQWKIPQRSVFTDVMMIYMGILLTGILLLFYGQFMLAWESGYFEFLTTRNIDFKSYLHAKYVLLIFLGILNYLLMLLMIFISPVIVYVNTALSVYNVGVNILVLFYLVTFTRKRLDLNASIFGTQGKGAAQYSAIVPVLIVPILIYLPFGLNGFNDTGIIVLAGLGILGLLLKKPVMNLILIRLQKQKYKMVSGFRQS